MLEKIICDDKHMGVVWIYIFKWILSNIQKPSLLLLLLSKFLRHGTIHYRLHIDIIRYNGNKKGLWQALCFVKTFFKALYGHKEIMYRAFTVWLSGEPRNPLNALANLHSQPTNYDYLAHNWLKKDAILKWYIIKYFLFINCLL